MRKINIHCNITEKTLDKVINEFSKENKKQLTYCDGYTGLGFYLNINQLYKFKNEKS